MADYNSVTSKINTLINDGGRSTAQEVREALYEIRDYIQDGDTLTEIQFTNLIEGFHRKDNGHIIQSYTVMQNGNVSFLLSNNETITIEKFVLPNTMPITFIDGLVELLNSKEDKIAGKQLSDENFTVQEKQKLANLNPLAFGRVVDTDGNSIEAIGQSDTLTFEGVTIDKTEKKVIFKGNITVKDENDIEVFTSNDISFEGFEIDGITEKLKNPIVVQDIRRFLNGLQVVSDPESTTTNNKKNLMFREESGTVETSNPRWFEMVAHGRNTGPGWHSAMRFIVNVSGIGDVNVMEITSDKVKVLENFEVLGSFLQPFVSLVRNNENILNAGSYDRLTYDIKSTTTSPKRIVTYRALASGGPGWHAVHKFVVKSNNGSEVEAFVITSNDDKPANIDAKGIFKPDKLDLSALGSYADDIAAATGGVVIGEGYINSLTGALHRRLK